MKELPLLYQTPPHWAASAMQDTMALLSDHAYLERKAATNALDLLNHWPAPHYPETWVATLSGVARDEALHLNQVTRLIQERGGQLERLHRSQYAGELRDLVRRGKGPHEILDRLLISALIEARSCERFDLLSKKNPDKALGRFYKGLCTSEFGHFTVFLKLGESVLGKNEVKARWADMLKAEARIIQQQPIGPKIHSGVPTGDILS